MDSPTERMPIACVHCAKAKAKCDKKVPCSRCVGKQIVCQSRATRRSSQNPNRRNNIGRTHSERALSATAGFQPPQFSPSAHIIHIPSPALHPTSHSSHGHRHTMSDFSQSMSIGSEISPRLTSNAFSHTPPDLNMPITPLLANLSQMEATMPLVGLPYDSDGDCQFLDLETHNNLLDFDPENMITDFMNPSTMLHVPNNGFLLSDKGLGFDQLPSLVSGPAVLGSPFDVDGPLRSIMSNPILNALPKSPSTAALREHDAVMASHQAWPFFQCNVVEKKVSFFPPKTASMYLEGLAQTLGHQATWHKWNLQLDEKSLDVSTERNISTEAIVGWSREKLLAITQGFLHKALDIHRAEKDGTPCSPDSTHETFLMLPPPNVIQFFLRSYVVRYEPYYSSIPGGRLDPNLLMYSTTSKAASLLILLMVASGATATATKEARYVASGLTEACRISLFDTVEKDISQARNILVLRSALLFTCLAAWSGDKWHMDIAMGQRGMYLAMLSHAGLLESSSFNVSIKDGKNDPNCVWEEWKEHEGRHRLAHSWIIVDQEMSLFSDTTPLLSIVDMHTPIPDSDDLWHASSVTEWLSVFEKEHSPTYSNPTSIRDLFTKFVDGELTGQRLSPTQLRLLLHPLQAQVCQLRQFIACLPDGGSHHKASRAVSKAATKARLEEISTLLQQWYAISRQSFSGNKGTCWTTCANLIMYHLISLNAITSFKCIEQFARREVPIGTQRHATWLQMKCIDQPEETYFHCGQVLRLIRSMPRPVRPPWWAGAVYRVALTAWANSIANNSARYTSVDSDVHSNIQFAIDNLTPEHESISQYVKYQEGIPMLTGSDGRLVPLSVPSNILNHCVEVLDDDSSMRLADGIKRKLRLFIDNWKER